MQEKAKEILSIFLKIPAEQIQTATVIDRSAVSSSILLHRMYAKLAAEGIAIKDYQQLRTFGDLQQQLNGKIANENTGQPVISTIQYTETAMPAASSDATGIGIDIEAVSAMPVTGDFREDTFYTMNFSAAEMAHCILQPDPYASFAGLFAAKEAIAKADNRFRKIEFKNIRVEHLPGGKPYHEEFTISVSHAGGMAVAVAVPIHQNNQPIRETATGAGIKKAAGIPAILWALMLTSLLLSIIALYLIVKNR